MLKAPQTLSNLLANGTTPDQLGTGLVVLQLDTVPATKAANPDFYPFEAVYAIESAGNKGADVIQTLRRLGCYEKPVPAGYTQPTFAGVKTAVLHPGVAAPNYWPLMIQVIA